MVQRKSWRWTGIGGVACGLALGMAVSVAAVQAESGSFDSDGVTIHYQVEGVGEPVLLIHGYRASGSVNWQLTGVTSALKDKYQVITIDNRGHGKSGKPTDPAEYGRNMVLDQVRLMDHLGIESAHVAGYSMGGMITLRMLVDHPERIRSAAICGMGWTKDDEQTRARFAAEPAADTGANPVHVAVRQAWGELGVSQAALEEIMVPMITIVGDRDGLYERSVKPLREVRPDVPLVLIEGATHSGAPLKLSFREALRTWIDQQPESPPETRAAMAAEVEVRVPWGRFDRSVINESSALQKSRIQEGVFWTLNDSGNAAALFAINDTGEILGSFDVGGVKNVDWESLATDDQGHLYIGDVGNNASRRRDLVVYVVDEPDLSFLERGTRSPPLVIRDRLEFSYAEQSQPPDGRVRDFDSESIFWSGGNLYLLTKERTQTGTALYRFDRNQAGTSLRQLGRFDFGDLAHPTRGTATAADVSPDGRYLAVLGYQAVFIFPRSSQGDNFLSSPPYRIALNQGVTKQCEGLAWDGMDLLITNEQGEIHRLTRPIERSLSGYP